jgi:hypothetical protein
VRRVPYKISYLAEDAIVFTEYVPPLVASDYADIVAANIAMGAEKGSLRFLGDCTALPWSDSLIDVYELGDLLDSLGLDPRIREALVVKMDEKADPNFEFFVTVTSNRGLQVRLFPTIEEATAWLKS